MTDEEKDDRIARLTREVDELIEMRGAYALLRLVVEDVVQNQHDPKELAFTIKRLEAAALATRPHEPAFRRAPAIETALVWLAAELKTERARLNGAAKKEED